MNVIPSETIHKTGHYLQWILIFKQKITLTEALLFNILIGCLKYVSEKFKPFG